MNDNYSKKGDMHSNMKKVSDEKKLYQSKLHDLGTYFINLDAEDINDNDFAELLQKTEETLSNFRKQIKGKKQGKLNIKKLDKCLVNKKRLKIKDRNILLISEKKNKIILPYKGEEIKELLPDECNLDDIKKVVKDYYTIPLSNYKFGYVSRFKEAFKLMREREKASLLDSLDLALELMINNLLYPAVIAACKNLDQLDIYLDCLNTNELDDFPFFEIQYELKDKIKNTH